MARSNTDMIMDLAWKKVNNRNDVNEILKFLSDIQHQYNFELSDKVFATILERIKWEFMFFKKPPKRTMRFSGFLDNHIYLKCKKCDLIMTSKTVKRPVIESPVCPDCNNSFLYTYNVTRKDDNSYKFLYNRLSIPSGWRKIKTKVKYNMLHFIFCVMEKFKK